MDMAGAEKEILQQHRYNFGNIHHAQRDICNEMTDIEMTAIAEYGLQRQSHDFVLGVRGIIPYGSPYKKLPPGLFLESERPVLPTSADEAAKLASRYEERMMSPVSSGHEHMMGVRALQLIGSDPEFKDYHKTSYCKPSRVSPLITLNEKQWQYGRLNDNNRSLQGRLLDLMETNDKIVESKWKIYRRMGEKALCLPRYEMDILSLHRTVNTQRMWDGHDGLLRSLPLGNFEFFMHSRTATEFRAPDPSKKGWRLEQVESAFPAAFGDLPIGDYGMDFTHNVMRWALHGIERTESILGGFAAKMARDHEPMFNFYWGLGKDDYYGGLRDTLIATHISGKMAVAHLIMLLTAEYVEGYNTGNELLRDLVRADLIAEFSRYTLLGLTAPPILEGIFFEGLVQKQGKKGIRLNPDILRAFASKRKQVHMRMAEAWKGLSDPNVLAERAPDIPDFAGFICPAAYQNGAISKQARNCLEWCDNNDRLYSPFNDYYYT